MGIKNVLHQKEIKSKTKATTSILSAIFRHPYNTRRLKKPTVGTESRQYYHKSYNSVVYKILRTRHTLNYTIKMPYSSHFGWITANFSTSFQLKY